MEAIRKAEQLNRIVGSDVPSRYAETVGVKCAVIATHEAEKHADSAISASAFARLQSLARETELIAGKTSERETNDGETVYTPLHNAFSPINTTFPEAMEIVQSAIVGLCDGGIMTSENALEKPPIHKCNNGEHAIDGYRYVRRNAIQPGKDFMQRQSRHSSRQIEIENGIPTDRNALLADVTGKEQSYTIEIDEKAEKAVFALCYNELERAIVKAVIDCPVNDGTTIPTNKAIASFMKSRDQNTYLPCIQRHLAVNDRTLALRIGRTIKELAERDKSGKARQALISAIMERRGQKAIRLQA